ncbi:MAG: 50S ribosomal protein L28 [Acidobacteria bacterium]|nr:50S ribosomal protein L28 [Acidobacteriota bacterium]
MAWICEICGKKPRYGKNVSHAHNLTSRLWRPNLQRLRVRYQGVTRRRKVCTRCLRSGRVDRPGL